MFGRASVGTGVAAIDGAQGGIRGYRPHVKRADLRWLAVVPIVVAVPFLFFGLIWQALVQSAVGVGLLVLGFGIWMVFAED